MEQAVERVFTKEILKNAASQFGITVEEKPVGEFENYLFKGKLADGTDRILRLTHSSHRSKEEIEAELKFLKYARENGANAAGSLTSLNGNLVEVQNASDGTSFYASMFEWADGQLVDRTNPTVWNDDLMYTWGKTIGKLHALTVDYPVTNREHWDEEAYLNEMVADEVLGVYTKELIEEIQSYERKKDSYGLIHSDLHLHNFFVNDKGEITVFDFDDLQYNYFISDIAIVLYYTAWGSKASLEEKSQFAKKQLEVFRKGYETEYVLDEVWYSRIPDFLKCRDITLYHVLNMKYDEKTPRVIELCEELKDRIVNRKTIIEI
ncbi:phosphotransferase enzyme family protein [Bacillus sp. AFS017336]|uniref:phosphotransferase enzyme family protein n=1 Tax=Bacillus sp. AFS017336 TaxID=2033489 RepID=UPI000BF0DF25|nr:phosphotransferase [Bacillus sp. AFS017336]PEL13560.1 aminoglycoside phosphotransferase [Bacillus sp. AFS017336]